MNYVINEEQFDRIMKLYFDKRFKDSEFDTRESDFGDWWTGFWISDNNSNTLLVGYPEAGDSNEWFSNGQILDGWKYFDMTPKHFYDKMKKYLVDTYGVPIGNII